jgi:hypothetical protein
VYGTQWRLRRKINSSRNFVFNKLLATGDSFSTIGHSFRVGFETVRQVVTEACQAICRRMENIYLPEPTTKIWEQSAKGFEDVWQFPDCIGSVTRSFPRHLVL